MRDTAIGLLFVLFALLSRSCDADEGAKATCEDIAQAYFSLCEEAMDLDLDEVEEMVECFTDQTTDCEKVVSCLNEQDTCEQEALECLFAYESCYPEDCPAAEVDCYDSEFSDGDVGFDLNAAFGRCIYALSEYDLETDYQYTTVQICNGGECVEPDEIVETLCGE